MNYFHVRSRSQLQPREFYNLPNRFLHWRTDINNSTVLAHLLKKCDHIFIFPFYLPQKLYKIYTKFIQLFSLHLIGTSQNWWVRQKKSLGGSSFIEVQGSASPADTCQVLQTPRQWFCRRRGDPCTSTRSISVLKERVAIILWIGGSETVLTWKSK